MKLTPAQATIAKDKHRFRVLNCGRRFGKTSLAIEEIKGKALAALENDKICYIAPTYQQARDIAWETIKRELLPITLKVNESRLELDVQNKDGKKITIILRGWEAIETLRGQYYTFLVLDEVASMRNFWVGWNEVLSPTLIDRKGDALFISTPKGFNHFYDLYNQQDKDENYKSFHFTSYDNPYIPVEEIEREKLGKPEDAFAQEYLADFRKQTGLVYKEFNRDLHIIDFEPGNISEFVGGIDFGFTNPCAVIHIKRDYDNTYWVMDEWYVTGRTDEQVGDYVRSCKFNKVYPDPENQAAIAVLQNKGISVAEVIKDRGSVMVGINKVRDLLKRNKLKIHKRCVNLISEFETYMYPEKKELHNEQENPIKENDHALDALRYAIMTNQPDDPLSPAEKLRIFYARKNNTQNHAR